MSEIIQLNEFSKYHDEKNVFFCKTDLLEKDFDTIKKLNNKVILITGNSDFSITDNLVKKCPPNVVKWFCQNNAASDSRLISMPMGIENSFESKRLHHGCAWNFAIEKNKILSTIFDKKISGRKQNLIYANFNVNTNLKWRNKIKNLCEDCNHVTFKNYGLSYQEFISDVISHDAVLCPVGNSPEGVADNHRIYEVLYSNRVPIVFSKNQNILYDKLYKFLPIVLLDDENKILDKDFMLNQIYSVKNKNINKIKLSYWKNILNYEKECCIAR